MISSRDYECELNREWKIYCNMSVTNARYEDYLKELGVFKTIQQFWRFFNFFKTNVNIPNGSSLSIFKNGSYPRWEHHSNRMGGRWIFDVEDSLEAVMELWIQILVHIIGEKLDFSDDINGSLISRRSYDNEDGRKFMIYIWTKSTETEGRLEALKRILPQNLITNLHFKPHNPFIVNTPPPSQSPKYSIDHSDMVSPLIKISKMNGDNKEPNKIVSGLYRPPMKRSSSTSILELKSNAIDDSTDSETDTYDSSRKEDINSIISLEKSHDQSDSNCNNNSSLNGEKPELKENNNAQHVIITSLKKKKRRRKNKSSSQLITSTSKSHSVEVQKQIPVQISKPKPESTKSKSAEYIATSTILLLIILSITIYFLYYEKKSILKS